MKDIKQLDRMLIGIILGTGAMFLLVAITIVITGQVPKIDLGFQP
ncbi:MAG TPA: hypothetical protein VKM55_04030 [Candidatus Lokiarchaeia archaeon]|nr:hypothetical protein [Candidatus Lokiarchaeia archaeon]